MGRHIGVVPLIIWIRSSTDLWETVLTKRLLWKTGEKAATLSLLTPTRAQVVEGEETEQDLGTKRRIWDVD